jgi:hypothetical protein
MAARLLAPLAYTDSFSALQHCSACCTPAPPNLHACVSLPPPPHSSLAIQSVRPAGSESVRPDSSQPARPDPVAIRIVRRLDPSRPARSELSSAIRAHTDRSQSMSDPEFVLSVLPYVPAMMATSHLSTSSRESEATEPLLGAAAQAAEPALEAPCSTPGGPLCGVGSTPAVGRA